MLILLIALFIIVSIYTPFLTFTYCFLRHPFFIFSFTFIYQTTFPIVYSNYLGNVKVILEMNTSGGRDSPSSRLLYKCGWEFLHSDSEDKLLDWYLLLLLEYLNSGLNYTRLRNSYLEKYYFGFVIRSTSRYVHDYNQGFSLRVCCYQQKTHIMKIVLSNKGVDWHACCFGDGSSRSEATRSSS